MTDRAYVQLLIGDTGADVFTTDNIDEFLSRNDDDVNLAAADACLAMAMDAKLLDKSIKIGNWSLGRTGLIDKLRNMAAAYRQLAGQTPAYAVIEQAHTDLSATDILDREAIRD